MSYGILAIVPNQEDDFRQRLEARNNAILGKIPAPAPISAKVTLDDEDHGGWTLDYMVEQIGTVAVVSIHGDLIPDYHPYNRYYGEVSYEEIRHTLREAEANPEVKSILLDVNSPGGTVAGISELTKFIQGMSKPVYTYSGVQMCSAGYWLGSVGKKVFTDSLAYVGSVGVVTVLRSFSKMYEKEGIANEVIRSGKHKYLGNPYEPITEEVVEYFKERQDHIHNVFASHVADSRKLSREQVDKDIATGEVFLGTQALALGLVDQIASFEEVVRLLNSRYTAAVTTVGGQQPSYTYTNMVKEGGSMKIKTLTEKARAILLSGAQGVTAETLAADPEMVQVVDLSPEQAAKAEAARAEALAAGKSAEEAEEAAVEAALKAEDEAPAAAATPTDDAPAAAAEPTVPLKTYTDAVLKVSSLEAQLAAETAKIAQHEESLAKAQDLISRLTEVAVAATARVQLIVDGKASDLSALDPEQVLSAYAKAMEAFTKINFGIGGKAQPANTAPSAASPDDAGARPASRMETAVKTATSFARR